MDSTELRSAQQSLGLSDGALAAELAVTPAVVRAWRSGSTKIPKRDAQMLRWRVAGAERQAALAASGLPECAWVAKWDASHEPTDPKARRAHFDSFVKHSDSCPTCIARQRYIDERFGPMPPFPSAGWLRIFDLFARLPSSVRPAVGGAIILGAMSAVRVVFAIPALARQPSKIGEALLAIAAAAGAGAVGGLAYSLTRPTLRRLGRPGNYLTGIVCVFAYMGALALVAPIAFGESIVKDRSELVIFAIVSTFFGLFVGHSWFGEDGIG